MTKEVIHRHMATHTTPLIISQYAETSDPAPNRSEETLQVRYIRPSQKYTLPPPPLLLNISQRERNTHICHFPGRELQDRSAAAEACVPSLSIHPAPFPSPV